MLRNLFAYLLSEPIHVQLDRDPRRLAQDFRHFRSLPHPCRGADGPAARERPCHDFRFSRPAAATSLAVGGTRRPTDDPESAPGVGEAEHFTSPPRPLAPTQPVWIQQWQSGNRAGTTHDLAWEARVASGLGKAWYTTDHAPGWVGPTTRRASLAEMATVRYGGVAGAPGCRGRVAFLRAQPVLTVTRQTEQTCAVPLHHRQGPGYETRPVALCKVAASS